MANKFLDYMGLALVVEKMKMLVLTTTAALQPKEDGKGLSSNDFTDEEKAKLIGIEDNANNYTLPATLPASMIDEDALHRFVTDSEKTNWNDKYTKTEIENMLAGVVEGLDWKETVATFADLAIEYPTPEVGWAASVVADGAIYRWDGTEWAKIINDAIYVHPTTPGNIHLPSGGVVGQILYNSADGVGAWDDAPAEIEIEAITAEEIQALWDLNINGDEEEY